LYRLHSEGTLWPQSHERQLSVGAPHEVLPGNPHQFEFSEHLRSCSVAMSHDEGEIQMSIIDRLDQGGIPLDADFHLYQGVEPRKLRQHSGEDALCKVLGEAEAHISREGGATHRIEQLIIKFQHTATEAENDFAHFG
jgi:hypothetical protein